MKAYHLYRVVLWLNRVNCYVNTSPSCFSWMAYLLIPDIIDLSLLLCLSIISTKNFGWKEIIEMPEISFMCYKIKIFLSSTFCLCSRPKFLRYHTSIKITFLHLNSGRNVVSIWDKKKVKKNSLSLITTPSSHLRSNT